MECKSKSVSRRLIWSLLGLLLISPLVMLGYLAQGIWGGCRVDVARLKHKDHPIYQHRQREDGSVDYLEALNAIYSDGVTDDNNIVAVLRSAQSMKNQNTPSYLCLLELKQLVDSVGEADKQKDHNDLLNRTETNGQLTADEWMVIRSWLALQEDALDTMAKEVQQRDRYFEWPLRRQSNRDDFSGFGQIQSYKTWFLIRARVQALDGQYDQAIASLGATARLAELVSQGFSTIEQFNSIYVWGLCSERLGPLLMEQEVNLQQLSALERQLDEFRPLENFRRYVDLGHRIGLSRSYDLLLGGGNDEFSQLDNRSRVGVPWIPAGWASGVSLVDQKDDHCDWLLEKLDAIDTVAALDEVAAWQVSENEIASYEGDWSRFFSSPKNETEQRVRSEFNFLFSGGTEFNILGLVYEAEVRRRILLLAIYLRRHYQSEGQLPKTLDELELEDAQLCLDPFSGRQLIYEPAESDRFELYSVGQDRQDDGGDAEADVALW